MVSDYRLGPYNPATQLHCSERIDGDRHPQKVDSLEAMINQNAHGSGDAPSILSRWYIDGGLIGAPISRGVFLSPQGIPIYFEFFSRGRN